MKTKPVENIVFYSSYYPSHSGSSFWALITRIVAIVSKKISTELVKIGKGWFFVGVEVRSAIIDVVLNTCID